MACPAWFVRATRSGLIALLFYASACGSVREVGASPANVVRAYMDAVSQGDTEGASRLVHQSPRTDLFGNPRDTPASVAMRAREFASWHLEATADDVIRLDGLAYVLGTMRTDYSSGERAFIALLERDRRDARWLLSSWTFDGVIASNAASVVSLWASAKARMRLPSLALTIAAPGTARDYMAQSAVIVSIDQRGTVSIGANVLGNGEALGSTVQELAMGFLPEVRTLTAPGTDDPGAVAWSDYVLFRVDHLVSWRTVEGALGRVFGQSAANAWFEVTLPHRAGLACEMPFLPVSGVSALRVARSGDFASSAPSHDLRLVGVRLTRFESHPSGRTPTVAEVGDSLIALEPMEDENERVPCGATKPDPRLALRRKVSEALTLEWRERFRLDPDVPVEIDVSADGAAIPAGDVLLVLSACALARIQEVRLLGSASGPR